MIFPSSEQLVSLSAGISAFMQKINANDSSNPIRILLKLMTELKDLMKKVMEGTADSAEIDKLTFKQSHGLTKILHGMAGL